MGLPAGLQGRQQRLWLPEQRTLVPAGGEVEAIAVSRTEVLAAARNVVFVYDFTRGEWRPPIELASVTAPVTALAADPVSGEIWVGTRAGDVSRGLPGFLAWDAIALPVSGPIERIVPWPADAATYILARDWWRVDASSTTGFPVDAGRVPAGVRAEGWRGQNDPYLAAARNSLGLDADMRRWPITDIARGEEPDEFWIATAGGGIVRFRSRGGERESLRFGLVAPGAASMAFAGGRLWFGGDGRGRQNGVAAATPDLSRWWHYDAVNGAPSGFVAEIAFDGRRLWFAAQDGLFRFDPESTGRRAWTRFTSADGLPSDRVRSVLHHEDRIWAGTDRGLVAFDTAGNLLTATILLGSRTARLAVSGGTLWIASEAGLRTLPLSGATGSPVPPPGVPAFLANGRTLDVVAGVRTWVLSDLGLFQLDTAGAERPLGDALLQRIGAPVRLANQDGRLWVAGTGGVAHRDPETGIWEAFTVPADIPGPVLDVLPAGDDVWIGTAAGALRLRWR